MKENIKKFLLKALAVVLILLGLALLGWYFKLRFDYLTYKNVKEGIVISYPRGWQVNEYPTSDTIVAFVAPPKHALQLFNENISITKTDLSRHPQTIQQYAETAAMQMTAVFNETVVSEKSFLKISGHDAVKIVFRSPGAVEVVLIAYAFIYRDVAYNISYMGLTEQFLTAQSKLNYVIRTMKLYF